MIDCVALGADGRLISYNAEADEVCTRPSARLLITAVCKACLPTGGGCSGCGQRLRIGGRFCRSRPICSCVGRRAVAASLHCSRAHAGAPTHKRAHIHTHTQLSYALGRALSAPLLTSASGVHWARADGHVGTQEVAGEHSHAQKRLVIGG